MKKIIATTLFLIISLEGFTQILKPVTWSYSYESINEKEGNLIFKAVIDNGWHVYSQFIAEGGPIPTTFTFNKNKAFDLLGKISEMSTQQIGPHDIIKEAE